MLDESFYEQTTDGILVRVEPQFLPNESEPRQNRFVWAYTIEIENRSSRHVKLLTRSWRITEVTGLVHEIDGDGVVGEQPELLPGDAFQYTSAAPLASPSGLMGGRYGMVDLDTGAAFDVIIPTFALDCPHSAQLAN